MEGGINGDYGTYSSMRRYPIVTGILLLALVLPAAAISLEEWAETAQGNFSSLSREQVDAVIDPLIRNGTYTGMVVVLVDQNGTAIYEYGVADRTLMTRPGSRTLYGIGSISKTFTGLLLAESSIQGDLNLTIPAGAYAPEGVTFPSLNGREITLEDLATHTSGLPSVPDSFLDVPAGLPVEDEVEALFSSYTTMNADEAYAFIGNYSLTRQPGTEWEYSNLGSAITGEIVARRTEGTFADSLRTRILEPLGMNHTTTVLTDEDRNTLATGYLGLTTPPEEMEILQFTDFWAPAGGIYSDGEDMAIYAAAQLGIVDTPLMTAIHASHQPRAVRSEGPPAISEGLLWDIAESRDGTRLLLKAGETSGYQADIGLIPDEKKGVVILANTAHLETRHIESEVVTLLSLMHGDAFS